LGEKRKAGTDERRGGEGYFWRWIEDGKKGDGEQGDG
jgi:hypothetical protein